LLRPDTFSLRRHRERPKRAQGAVRQLAASAPFATSFEGDPMSFAATPIFLLMAFVTYFQLPPLCAVPGSFGFLSTMWLMYAIMGVVHSGPWFSLAWSLLKGTRTKQRQLRQGTYPEPTES